MSDELSGRLFAAVDTMRSTDIADFLTEDARLTFGNADPVHGREAIVEALDGFFSTIAGLRHDTANVWTVGADTVVESRVTYRRLDDTSVSVPAVSIWHRDGDGLITDYRIYVDLAPVYAP